MASQQKQQVRSKDQEILGNLLGPRKLDKKEETGEKVDLLWAPEIDLYSSHPPPLAPSPPREYIYQLLAHSEGKCEQWVAWGMFPQSSLQGSIYFPVRHDPAKSKVL